MTMDTLELPAHVNAAQWIVDRHVAAGRGGRTAIHFEGATWTYADFQSLVNRSGNLLRELGVEIENRVGLLMLDSPEYLAAFLGAVKIGAVPICLNTLLGPASYEYMLNDSRAKVVIAHEEVAANLFKVRANLRYLRHVVILGSPPSGYLSHAELIGRATAVLDPEPRARDDWSFWAYTSGSTGEPKAVMHTHATLMAGTWYFPRHVMALGEADTIFCMAKLFFTYGTGLNMYMPLANGAATVLNPRRPVPDELFRILHRYRPTIFAAVPTMYAAMLQVKDAARTYDLGSLRMCWSGGEALPPPIYHEWRDRFGVEILELLGSSELIHGFCTTRPGMNRPGSIGVPVPGYELRIVDDALTDVPDGKAGRLMIAGPSVFAGYANRREKNEATFFGKWMLSSDTVRRDGEGIYWFVGRSDDMLKVGGAMVSPIEIENVLVEHPAVLEAAVIGAPDEHQLVKPKAVVVLKQGFKPGPELEAELTALVKGRLARYKYPRWYVFVDQLPKTATGKIQRFQLRDGTLRGLG
ncbi:MAG: benzoate-CoA ligase family protein [Candidatus Rokubacteria bacterium]|nr:benzoate-CoA ligase family protein [Candidatus Rokubacteria bacterium]MBI3105504.1 benzoate-CoA ligase family protein [Candidatus Rokubacteria bacterium]